MFQETRKFSECSLSSNCLVAVWHLGCNCVVTWRSGDWLYGKWEHPTYKISDGIECERNRTTSQFDSRTSHKQSSQFDKHYFASDGQVNNNHCIVLFAS